MVAFFLAYPVFAVHALALAFMTGATTNADITSSLTTAFSSIVSDCLSAIAAIVPIAVPIMGALIIIKLGINTFRMMASRRG